MKGSTTSSIQTSFPITPGKTAFGLYPFLISDFSSLYADDNNFDIMIATVDGIDGPLNRMKFNGYFLINGFTLVNSAAINTLNSGFVAYSHTSLLYSEPRALSLGLLILTDSAYFLTNLNHSSPTTTTETSTVNLLTQLLNVNT